MEQLVDLDYPYIEAMDTFIHEIVAFDKTKEVNGAVGYLQFHSLHDWIEKEKKNHLGIELNEGFVPATTCLYMLDDEVVGIVNIRHCLNDYLRNMGGHIGYSVAPKYRRQGFATKMLNEAVKLCKKWDISPVLVTCHKENIASKKTIEKCGGFFESEYKDDEECILRYWIKGEK